MAGEDSGRGANVDAGADTAGRDGMPLVPLVAKSIPPSPSAAPRERIMRLLARGRAKRFTLVSAAEGYGKTTALADFCRALRDEGSLCAWFSADEDDREPARFWLNFRYALDAGIERYGGARLSCPGVPSGTAQAWKLANDLSLLAESAGGAVIIIDGFDCLSSSDALEEFSRFCRALSANVHLYFSSRTRIAKDGLPHARNAEVPLRIDAHALAFTRDEAASFFAERTGVELSCEVLDAVEEKTLGWPYGVEALAELVDGKGFDVARLERSFVGESTVNDFFQYEVFDNLSAHEQEFLVKCSQMGVLSPRCCGYALDEGGAEGLLRDLSRRNVFLEPDRAADERYVLHPLFASWLRQRARDLPAEEVRTINARASRWCETHACPTLAAKHRILSIDRSSLFNLAHAAFPQAQAEFFDQQTSFRDEVSPDGLSACFCLLAAWAYIYCADLGNAKAWLGRLEEHGDEMLAPAMRLSAETIKAKCCYLSGDFEEGERIARRIEPKLEGPQTVPLRIMLVHCYAEACDQRGERAQAAELHENAAVLAQSCSFDFMGAINQYEMAFSLVEEGRFHAALQMCRTIRRSFSADHPVMGAADSLSTYAGIALGELDGVDDALRRARRLVSKNSNPDMYLDWCTARAWAHFSLGRKSEADAVLLEAIDFVKYGPASLPRNAAVQPFQARSVMKAAAGEADAALRVWRDFDVLGAPLSTYSQLVREYVEASCLEEADADALSRVREAVAGCGFKALELRCALKEASELFTLGRKTQAVRLVHDQLLYAAEEGVVEPFLERAGELRALLSCYLTTARPDRMRMVFMRSLLSRSEFTGDENFAATLMEEARLTAREREILKLATSGLTRRDIASELCISETTVKTHLSHLYGKFGVTRFADLLARASELGL